MRFKKALVIFSALMAMNSVAAQTDKTCEPQPLPCDYHCGDVRQDRPTNNYLDYYMNCSLYAYHNGSRILIEKFVPMADKKDFSVMYPEYDVTKTKLENSVLGRLEHFIKIGVCNQASIRQ